MKKTIASVLFALFFLFPTVSLAKGGDFFWGGIYLTPQEEMAPSSSQNDTTEANEKKNFKFTAKDLIELEEIFEKVGTGSSYENRTAQAAHGKPGMKEQGAIACLLKNIEQTPGDITYHGMAGLQFDSESELEKIVENLSNTYGIFITFDKLLEFNPEETVIFNKSRKTYVTYIFGALNFFNMESRLLIYSRPFFVIHSADVRKAPLEMVKTALNEFAERLKDPNNVFTRKTIDDLRKYFSSASGAIPLEFADTYGVTPICDKCVAMAGENMSEDTRKKMKTFMRYYFNVALSQFKPVVFVPEKRGKVINNAKDAAEFLMEGHVAITESCFEKYDESGRYQMCVNIPNAKNSVVIAVRSQVEKIKFDEDSYTQQYDTIVDIALERPAGSQREYKMLTNRYEILLMNKDKASEVSFFNTVINAIANLNETIFE